MTIFSAQKKTKLILFRTLLIDQTKNCLLIFAVRRIHMPIDRLSAPTRLVHLNSESYVTFIRDNNILTRYVEN